MTDQSARLHLLEQARSTWDDDAARTLMGALVWDVDQLATKQDLREVELRLQVKLESLVGRIEASAKSTIVSLGTLMVAIAAVVVAVVQLSR